MAIDRIHDLYTRITDQPTSIMKKNINTAKRILILAILVLSMGCEPEMELVQRFTIQKGEHYATPRIVETLQRNRLVFEARFNESAIYDLGDPASQTNKNKLLGFADCNAAHHDNSARFAWQWMNNQVEIFAYCYANGERHEKFVGVVEINEYNRYEIELTDTNYIFYLNDNEPVYMERGSVCSTGVYYKLWPYFGGSIPAPHTVQVSVKMIY